MSVLLLSLLVYDLHGQCVDNIFYNGSFTCSAGENVTAPGWTGISSPDANDASGNLNTTPCYNWTGTPLTSSNGGIWQNLFSTSEAVLQTVFVIPGQSYLLQFEFASQGITCSSYNFSEPTGVIVYINGTAVYTTPLDESQFTWEAACYSFIASDSSITIGFSAANFQYVGIDGVCLVQNSYNSINLGNDTILCQGDSLILNATTPNGSYLWQDYSTDPSYTVTQQGFYWVEVLINCIIIADMIDINYIPLPTVSLGNDTSLCHGDTLILNATASVDSYLWQDSSNEPIFTITRSGIYWVEVANACGITSDTINISYNALPTVHLGNDTVLCQGNTLILTPDSGDSYWWQDNSKNSMYYVIKQGTYWVEITKNNCTAADTINIFYNPLPIIDLGNDTILCQGETLILNAKTSGDYYLWQDGSKNPTFTITRQGIYWVDVTNTCGIASDTINISYNVFPTFNLGNDTLLCQGETLILNATDSSDFHLWQDHSTHPVYTITEQGIYWVKVTNACGINSDTLTVEFENCNYAFYIPNAFTPDNDNLNDGFSPVFNCNFSEYSFMIFNSWGEKIFETDNSADSWNGTYRGKTAPAGVYVYSISYKFENEIPMVRYGNVKLLKQIPN